MDLKSRGLLDDTLVVWATEFGRTPFEEGDKELIKKIIGRSHHHYGFSMWMAGGGVKPGITHGATDELGMHFFGGFAGVDGAAHRGQTPRPW